MKHTLIVLALFIITASLSGCASLRVEVAVYNGPMVDDPAARISQGAGLAKSIRDLAADLTRDDACNNYRSLMCKPENHRLLLAEIVAYYESLHIEELAEKWQESRKLVIVVDEKCNTKKECVTEDEQARAQLVTALVAYGNHCQTIVERLGMPELFRGYLIELVVLGLFPLPLPNDEYLAALGSIDETGRILKNISESVVAEDAARAANNGKVGSDVYLTRIQYVMASQKPGLLLTAVKNNPAPYGMILRKYMKSVFEDRYWTPINPVQTCVVGEGLTILVKDEIGNWQLKAVSADPTKVIEASSEATKAFIAAAAKLSAL